MKTDAGTLALLCENLRGLLAAQQKDQTALAFAVGKDRSWINKILNGRRGMSVSELTAIADFFHVEPYQLLQPGISRRTERRSGKDRRSGQDRRETEALKVVAKIREGLRLASNAVQTPSAPSDGDLTPADVARAISFLARRRDASAGESDDVPAPGDPPADRVRVPRRTRATSPVTGKR